MTNEAIAKEIAEQTLGEFATSFLGDINESSEMFCEESALKMAELKDRQFKEYLEKKQSELDGTRNKSNYELLDEIISEFFGEE